MDNLVTSKAFLVMDDLSFLGYRVTNDSVNSSASNSRKSVAGSLKLFARIILNKSRAIQLRDIYLAQSFPTKGEILVSPA